MLTVALSTSTGTGTGPALAFSIIPSDRLTPRFDVGGLIDLIGLDLNGTVVLAFDLSSSPTPLGSVSFNLIVPHGVFGAAQDVMFQGFLTDTSAPPFSIAVSNACRITESRPVFRDYHGACSSDYEITDADLGTTFPVDTRDITFSNTWETTGHSGYSQQSTFSLVAPGQGTGGGGPDAVARFTCTDSQAGKYTFTQSNLPIIVSQMYVTDESLNPLEWVGSFGSSTISIEKLPMSPGESVLIHLDAAGAGQAAPRSLVVTRRPYEIHYYTFDIDYYTNQILGLVVHGLGLDDTIEIWIDLQQILPPPFNIHRVQLPILGATPTAVYGDIVAALGVVFSLPNVLGVGVKDSCGSILTLP